MYFRVLFTCSGSITYALIADTTARQRFEKGTQSTFFIRICVFLFCFVFSVFAPRANEYRDEVLAQLAILQSISWWTKTIAFAAQWARGDRPTDPLQYTERIPFSNLLEIFFLPIRLRPAFNCDKHTKAFTEAQRASHDTRLILTNV